jgi:hypothetical protein
MRSIALFILAACGAPKAAQPPTPPAAPEAEPAQGDEEAGTLGHGSGPGTGMGVGSRVATKKVMTIGLPSVQGDLDRQTVRREVLRHQVKLEFCLEKEAVKKANLSGNTTARFVINARGLVLASTASGFDAEVDGCVVNVFRNIKFPAKPARANVQVAYPLTFHGAK